MKEESRELRWGHPSRSRDGGERGGLLNSTFSPSCKGRIAVLQRSNSSWGTFKAYRASLFKQISPVAHGKWSGKPVLQKGTSHHRQIFSPKKGVYKQNFGVKYPSQFCMFFCSPSPPINELLGWLSINRGLSTHSNFAYCFVLHPLLSTNCIV